MSDPMTINLTPGQAWRLQQVEAARRQAQSALHAVEVNMAGEMDAVFEAHATPEENRSHNWRIDVDGDAVRLVEVIPTDEP